MRKLLLLIVFVSGLILASKIQAIEQATSEVKLHTQSPPTTPPNVEFEDAYKKYRSAVEEYNKIHAEYVVARFAYLRSKTLSSEEKALSLGIKVIQARDEVLINYLKMLKTRLEVAVGVNVNMLTLFSPKISEEILWYEDHKSTTSIINNLNDLNITSKEAENRNAKTKKLYYEILLYIPLGEAKNYKSRFDDLLFIFDDRYTQARADQRDEYRISLDKIQKINVWLSDIKLIVEKTQGKLTDAENEILTKNLYGEEIYQAVFRKSTEAVEYLKNAAYKLIETSNELKTK